MNVLYGTVVNILLRMTLNVEELQFEEIYDLLCTAEDAQTLQ